MLDRPFSRRKALAAGGAGLIAASAGGSFDPAAAARSSASDKRDVIVEETTNVAIALSPDGQTIALDLMGILWTMPVGGGPLRRLSGDFDDLGQPDWSPDGRRIIFQSYRTGLFKLWSVAADGSDWQQHTDGIDIDDREPRWSPDGRTVAFSSDRSGRYAIHLLDIATGRVSQLSKGTSQDSQPAWSPDGKRIAYVADSRRLLVTDLLGNAEEVDSTPAPPGQRRGSDLRAVRPAEIYAPSFAPDGSLAHVRIDAKTTRIVHNGQTLAEADDLYPFRPGWLADGGLVYGATGKVRRQDAAGAVAILPFTATVPVSRTRYRKKSRDFDSTGPHPVVGIGSPVLSPDGRQIAFRALNDIWVMTVGGKPRRAVSGPYYKSDPAWAPDGKSLAYSTDRGGELDIWLHDLATGSDRQLTNLPGQSLMSCTWSNDGRTIAFHDQDTRLHVMDVASGAVRQIYERLFEPGRPSFSANGRFVALAAVKPKTSRFREGASQILVIDLTTGKGKYQEHGPGKSLSTRGDDGPVWSPDGKHMAYVFASTLWVVPVDETGTFTGPPRQLTTETTDAPSWSGDSSQILYLSNGRLRLVAATGGTPRTVPLRLNWANAKPRGRTIVRAGRLWDGSEPAYRRDVDVVIEGNRIADVRPHGGIALSDANATIIDGSGLALLPGLIDIHTHRLMQGYGAYGDRMGRLWLAMGITATRSPGCPAYHMVEDREALASGARVGARHYATGEAIDGSRIFYNFMRPVTEPGQLDLELARAEALDYDLIKTYVRLPHADQAKVIAAAHRLGMHVTSHYHYPALHHGVDGMEHLGATSRYGYSRTMTAQGAGYQDAVGLFAAAQVRRTPTLFNAAALFADDDSFLRDERILTLMPTWDYRRLKDRVDQVRNNDRAGLMSILERNVEQIKATMRAGGSVVTGTDAPIDFVAMSLHMNLRAMVRFGISPHDALLSATRNSAELMNEPIGSIRRGNLADMILVAGDPLARIEDAAAVRHILVNGTAHTPESLMAPFAAKEKSAIAHRTLAAIVAPDRRHWWENDAYVEACRGACCADHVHRV